MKLTNRCEYALLALAMLAREPEGELLSADTISEHQSIPKRFLQQILFSLKRGGFIRSVKGQDGGYQLSKKPENISLAEIIRFFEGPLAPTSAVSENFYEPSPIEGEPGLVLLMRDIRDYIAKVLENTTLADVAAEKTKKRVRR